jgi:hypothetical protein
MAHRMAVCFAFLPFLVVSAAAVPLLPVLASADRRARMPPFSLSALVFSSRHDPRHFIPFLFFFPNPLPQNNDPSP